MKKIAVFILFFSFFDASAQPSRSIDSRLAFSDSAANLYFISQGGTSALYNGRLFYGYPTIKGHAYYPEEGWQIGSVLYDGTWYHDVTLMFDIYKDEVVILHPNTTPLCLFSERVQKFYFRGLTFVRLSASKDHVPKSGFYQQLVEGNITIFSRRLKVIEEKIENLEIERNFISTYQYYALKDGIYYQIGKKKSLLNLLKDSRQNILQYLKEQKLKYKDDKEKAITQVAQFYNQLHK